MNINNPKYSFLAKLMHWGFVLIFIYGLIKQIDNVNQLEDNNLLKFEVLFALTFLSLLAIRFFYMKIHNNLRSQSTRLNHKNLQLKSFILECTYVLQLFPSLD